MAIVYEDYVWRLQCDAPSFDIRLPQDLEWVDEFSWAPVQQTIETTLTGALVIQESTQLRGRPITLQGKDDMGWIQRSVGEQLLQLRDTAGCTMVLSYEKYVDSAYTGNVLFQYDVMFRHYEPPPLELENVLRFDNFEQTAWYKVRNLKFMEAIPSASSPCTANVTLTVTIVSGTFDIGETINSDGDPIVIGTVMGFSDPTLQLYVALGTISSGDTVTGPNGSCTVD